WGLLKWVALPRWIEVPVAVALMDYTLYVWHVLTHRVPFLWRLHLVHHPDLDLSASTAFRFHFAETAPWRAAQIVLFGVDPRALSLADADAPRDPLPPLEPAAADRVRTPAAPNHRHAADAR